MALPNIDIVSGITGLEILVFGYACGLTLILGQAKKAASHELRNQSILMGIVFIGLYHSWFSVSTGFVLLATGGQPLGQVASLLGYAWGPAIGIPLWTYIASRQLKSKVGTFTATGAMIVLGGLFFINVYAAPLESTFYIPSAIGGLPDSGFTGTAIMLLAIMLLNVIFFIGPVYIRAGMKSQEAGGKWKRISTGIGAIMLGIFAIVDAGVADITLVALGFVRAFIFTSIFLIYAGVTLLDSSMKKVQVGTIPLLNAGSEGRGSIQGRIIKAMVGCVLVPLVILTGICISQLIPFSAALGEGETGGMVTWYIFIAAGIAAAMLFVTIRISRRIIVPIQELTQALEDMTKGDLSQEISLEVRQQGGEIGMLAQSFQNLLTTMRLGNQSYYHGDMTRAFSNYTAALDLFNATNNIGGQGMCLNNLGNIYRNWGNYEKALEHYERAVKLGEQSEDLGRLGGRYNNRGLLFLGRGRGEEAMQNFLKALAIDEKIGDERGIATRQRNIGVLHLISKKGDIARKHLEEALRIDKRMNNTGGIVEDEFQLGRLSLQEKDLEAAEYHLISALKRAETLENYPLMRDVLEEMVKLYEAQGNAELLYKTRTELAKVKQGQASEKDVVFVIDQSGSMKDAEKIVAARNGALEVFHSAINDSDNVAIVGFHSIINPLLPLTVKKGNSPRIRSIFEKLEASPHQTCFYDAVAFAIDFVRDTPSERQRWVVALTDGLDNKSKKYQPHSLAKYIQTLSHALNLILIGVGPELKHVFKEMNEIATATPQGKYIKIYSAQNVRMQIEEAFTRVKEIMAASEIEGFTPEEK